MKPNPELPRDPTEVVDMVIGQLMSGKPVDIESLCAKDPHLREQLDAILPAVQAMAEFGKNAAESNGKKAIQPQSEYLPPSPQPRELGDFRILREIGRGGMGVVYEADQLSLHRRVALKVLPFASVLDPRRLQRFKNEARAAAALKHPHIVSVYSVGCERSVHFYAMELVEGQSLAEVIRDLQVGDRVSPEWHGTPCRDSRRGASCNNNTQPIAALSTARSTDRRDFCRSVARLGIQAAEALHYAHECGIVHRDIKPSNLLIDHHAILWVTDFGLAMTQAGDGLTLTGDLIGTVRYMSPEQAAGNWAMVDHRADIYSLGVSLYELLSLRPAFEGKDRRTLLRKIDEEDAPLLRGIDGSIPKDLETIVMKAMAKEAHERYATATELAEDLQRFLDVKPIRARRSTRVQRFSRWAKRNPRLATASIIASILTILLAVGGPLVAIQKSNLAERLEQQLYEAEMVRAYTAVLHHEFERADEILRTYLPEPGAPDRRSFEWYHLWWSCQRVLNVPTIKQGFEIKCGKYSPNGEFLAFGDRAGSLAVHDAASRTVLWDSRYINTPSGLVRHENGPHTHIGLVNELVFTPDSELLVTASRDCSVRIWRVATGELLLTRPFELDVSALAISPDGQTLATGFNHPEQDSREPIHISIWHLDRTGRSVRLRPLLHDLGGLTGRVNSIAFSPDGRLLAAGCRDDRVRFFELKNGQPLPSLDGHSGAVRDVTFSPVDSNLLASASYEESATIEGGGEVRLWNLGDNSQNKTLSKNSWIRCLAFSPDGTRLVAGDHDGVMRIWDVDSRELQRELPGHSKPVNDVAFSPDVGSILTVSEDRRARIWKQSSFASEPTRLSGHGACILRMAVSHDSRRLLSAGGDGFAKLWDTQTGRQEATFRTRGSVEHLFAADFSPDDKFIAVGGGFWKRPKESLEVSLWDLDTREQDVLFSAPTSNGFVVIRGMAFSPDGKRVAAAIGSGIQVWNLQTKQLVRVLRGDFTRVHDIAWSGKTDRIASVVEDDGLELVLWDGTSGDVLSTAPISPEGFWRLAFSADGQQLALTTDQGILVFDVVNRQFVQKLGRGMDVAFSPDGRRLATAGLDHTVKLWNLETGTLLLTFREPRNPIWAVCFSPDGRALFAGSDNGKDSVIHVWRAMTPEEVPLQVDSPCQ